MQDLQQQVRELDGDAWRVFFVWVTGSEYERRRALPLVEQARVEGETIAVEELRRVGALPTPEPVAGAATSVGDGKPPYSQWVRGTVYLAGEHASADKGKTIWRVRSASPTTERPGEGTAWVKVWPAEVGLSRPDRIDPEPEPEAEETEVEEVEAPAATAPKATAPATGPRPGAAATPPKATP